MPFVGRKQSPISWPANGGLKPKDPGSYAGLIYGQEFKVNIRLDRVHARSFKWTMTWEIFGDEYVALGNTGGVYRALSTLREDLERVCHERGIGT